VSAIAPTADRAVPPLGGFNATFLSIELRRLLRNRRTVVFTLVMPAVFFEIFGTASGYRTTSVGVGNVTAYIMVSMAVYGAMLACTSAGAAVSLERTAGWSRQLRLTPLRPLAYVATKLVVAMVLGLAAVTVVFAAGLEAHAHLPLRVLLESGLIAWLGSLVFAAFGLFMGYLLPAENVMQVLGPVMAVLAFAGGLFVPLQAGSTFATLSQLTPLYGLATLSRAPITGGALTATALVNLLAWGAVFVGGAVWRFRRDTARV
jgi:ABC-2 type transport system permease protein